MARLVLDQDTLTRLGPLDKPLEICDNAGHTLGFFQPLGRDELEPKISREEIERRRQETGGRMLQEILQDLENNHG